MALSDSSPCVSGSRRRSLSEGCNLHLLAAIVEGEPLYNQPDDEEDDQQLNQPDLCVPAALAQRSKSESVICTAQGVKFEDKYRQYRTKLDNLMAVAANPASSNSNALIAMKALKYRNKTMERRRAYS